MAGIIKDTVSGIIDWITSVPAGGNPLDILEEEVNEGKYDYPVKDNVALKPEPIYTPTRKTQKTPDNVSAFRGARGPELMVIEPRSFAEDATQMISYLQEGKTIVLNFQLLDKGDAQRLVDFVSGATRALNGHQQKISDTVFIFAPINTSITADSLKAKPSMNDGIWAQR